MTTEDQCLVEHTRGSGVSDVLERTESKLLDLEIEQSDLIKSEKPESDMSSESGILADHLNEDNLNDDQVTEADPKQNSSSPELLLEAIRRIGRDKLRNIMLDLSVQSSACD